mmetsp:Transcript_49833/g.161174  ORF Transcript_49833/g.161174 Transcript_49833/m.161174 type:complete len:386 (+) Transcript_49833:5689-6846(+)
MDLVGPALHQVVGRRQRKFLAEADAAADPGDVSQVEGVVALGGGRPHLRTHGVVQIDCGLHHALTDSCHGTREAAQEPLHDGREDAAQTFGLEGRDENQIVVALVSACQIGPSGSGRAHGSDEVEVDQVPELRRLPVVPTTRVHPLPQQLDGRLRAVDLLRGHVQVVDENQAALAQWGAEGALPALVELAVDDVLSLLGCRLGAERECDRSVFVLVEPLQQLLLNDDCLAGACQAGIEHVVPAGDERLQEEGLAHRVCRRDSDRVHLCLLRDLEGRDLLRPHLPFVGLSIWVVVVDGAIGWERRLREWPEVGIIADQVVRILDFLTHLNAFDELVHNNAALRVGHRTERPYYRQPKAVIDLGLLFLRWQVFRLHLRVEWQLDLQQ